jgi:hypothetical protein
MWDWLRFFREGGGEKHIRDIRGILAVSGGSVDTAAIEEAASELGLTAEWRLAKQENA